MHIYFCQAFENLVVFLVYLNYASAQKLLFDYLLLIKSKIAGINAYSDFRKLFSLLRPQNKSFIGNMNRCDKIVAFYMNYSIHPTIKGIMTSLLIEYEGFSSYIKLILNKFLFAIYENT